MIEEINWHVKQALYKRLCRPVLATPPIRPADDGVVLFSMMGSAVLIPYLVAVKSLHHHLGRGRVMLLDDGTLTADDRAILKAHLGDPEILSIHDVDVGPCPNGGTWERLLTLLDLSAGNYMIQLDSDTVTVGPVPELIEAIDTNRSFTLLGESDIAPAVLPAPEFVRENFPQGTGAVSLSGSHVQRATESVMDRLAIPGLASPRYVRGCAGFAGFARGGDRGLATRFSQAAEAAVGRSKWYQWGSEQVASNFVVANAPDPLLLPADRYVNHWNMPLPEDSRMIHFIGTYRFHGMEYLARSRAAIRALNESVAA
ncbi:hypothetical protein [Sphingomonas sp. LaA6.9]|uniref:hypothetical protein n=1 Tax=Sphingomonas sp. LaA6.9 TaxID=2919914 RepID=UPI001F4F3B0B|nr:hypothetical protein [Sphingomonas sp. LaA6.9]MCJ8156285.1 hypothetical protein [Sphingomonas sp. LaA6.9]